MQGTVVSTSVGVGDQVLAGGPLVVVESMKMEHVVASSIGGIVVRIAVAVGDQVSVGDELAVVEAGAVTGSSVRSEAALDTSAVRADLAAVIERHEIAGDARRPDAVARRHERGRRTARENVTDLCDPGSFVEYGPLVVAAQRRRRSLDELIERTPADGLVGGVGHIDGRPVVVMSYDYTVLAGTQGFQNHRKKDRLFELAERQRLPVVLFAEGGGGRPGDTDADRAHRARLHGVSALRRAQRSGAAHRHRIRSLLRRERRACSAAATW